MPKYTDPTTGKSIRSDSPLSAAELEEAFEVVGGTSTKPPKMQEVPQSTVGRVVAGIGGGMVQTVEGIKQRALEIGGKLGIVDPKAVADYQAHIDQVRKLDAPLMSTTGGKVGQFLGQTAITAPIPGGVTGGFLKRAGTSVLSGGGLGFAQPTTSGESVGSNTALGGAAGLAGQSAISAGGKIYNAVKEPAKNVIQSLADKYNIRTTLGEVLQNPRVQKLETWLEEIPLIGLTGYRRKQQDETSNAAKTYLAKHMIDPAASDPIAAGRQYSHRLYQELDRVVEGIGKQEISPTNTKPVADALLKRYPDIFKKFQDTKREDIINNIVRGTADSERMVGLTTLKPKGTMIIPEGQTRNVTVSSPTLKPEGTMTTSGAARTVSSPTLLPEGGMVNIAPRSIPTSSAKQFFGGMENIAPRQVSVSSPTTKEFAGGMVDIAPRKVSIPKTMTFDEAWTLRDGLGEMIGQAKKKLGAGDVDKTTLSHLSKLYDAINRDIDGWADKIGKPQIKTAIKEANDAYKQYVVKADIIDRAYRKAAGAEDTGRLFSPQKFSTAINKIIEKNQYSKTFSPQEVQEMAGLANIMQVVKRAGQFMENPPTGNRWGLPMVSAGGIAGAGYYVHGGLGAAETAGATLSIVGLSRFLTSTETGKKLVLAASKVEPTSPAMKSIIAKAYNLASKMPAIAATQPSGGINDDTQQ